MYLVRFLCKRRVMAKVCYFILFINATGLVLTWLSFARIKNQIDNTFEPSGPESANDKPAIEINRYQLKHTHSADIFTYDLPDITSYNFVTGKRFQEYAIPVMSEKEASYGPNLDPLTVLVIPFSHVDPGYGNTMEGYYGHQTKKTLTYMVKKLIEHRNMTFQWAETVFLERWWRDISEECKSDVRSLIRNGQLEIVLGGWVMPDEASTHYVSVIDQLIEGHQWLIENLGAKPRNSWSNDPFGFSSTMPYLWKKAGIDNMVILRIHQAIKGTLMKLRTMEFNWKQLWSSDASNEILCHLMPYRGYWIGDVCGPYNQHICREYAFHRRDPVHKVVFLTETNLPERSRILYEQYRITAEIYRRHGLDMGHTDGVQLFLPIFLGEDFSFTSADEFELIYENYQKLFDYMNVQKSWKIKIKFGTLKEYFTLLRKYQSERSKIDGSRFPSLAGDFFPYSDYQNDYWTGYYTTRPFNKQLSRELQSLVRLADIMNVYAFALKRKAGSIKYPAYESVTKNLRSARRELGMFLHHDGITGTSVSGVIQDFQRRLFSAYGKARTALKLAVCQILGQGQVSTTEPLLADTTKRLSQNSISVQEVLDVSDTASRIYLINPSGKTRKEVVSFVTNSYVTVLDSSSKDVRIQINNEESNVRRVLFEVEIPPFGIDSYSIKPDTDRKTTTENINQKNEFIIENEYLVVEFDKDSGLLSGIVNKHGAGTSFQTALLTYTSKRSGAYIFAPTGNADMFLNDKPEVKVSKGSLMSQIVVSHKSVRIQISIYNTNGVQGQGVHVRTDIDMKRLNNKEIILRFQTDIESGNTFFTDQNGFQLLKRKHYTERPVEQNYYPLSTMAILEDKSRRFTLHSAQPHGVASLKSGWLEVMLDRQVSRDDGKGLGQGVSDNVLTVAQFVIQIESANVKLDNDNKYTYPSAAAILINEQLVYPLNMLILKDTAAEESKPLLNTFHPMKESLPCGVFVVGMRNLAKSNLEYNGTSIILHRKSINDDYISRQDSCKSGSDKMTIKTLFPDVNVKASMETSLTHLDNLKTINEDDNILPSPMELRSFKVDF